MIVKRFLAVFVDYAVMIVISSAIGTALNWTTGICAIVSFILLLFKDVGGISLGKRVFKLKVIDYCSNENVGIFRSIIRNIPLFLVAGLEIVLLCFNKGRRCGDIIGKTMVVEKEKKIRIKNAK